MDASVESSHLAEPPAATCAPDGQALASYRRRVGAYLLDALLVLVVAGALGWLGVRDQVDGAGALLDALPGIGFAVSLVYFGGFWRWRSATPGKLLLGLRIRRWEADGPLGWGVVLRRWAAMSVYPLVGWIPSVGFFAAIWPLADLLWPVWDKRLQTLHDKFAGTVVVRIR